MPSKLMLTYFGVDLLFVGTGALILGFSLNSESDRRDEPAVDNVAHKILLDQCPLTAGIVNAILIIFTFLVTLPAFFVPTNRFWLKLHGWLVVICAIFTLGLGLAIWFETLRTRSKLSTIWSNQAPLVQSLLQERFDCCGYTNSTVPPFLQDNTCQNSLVAAQKGGCVSPFSANANGFLDIIFTALFGMVGLDVLLILCVAMVNRWRIEQQRYKHIDEKNRDGGM
ncbi:hypothetical protein EJ05DRAFT_134 [Pseudovirgaria hyperparasitica]|uniref:Tetraspanin n=1 Tax=Pseudovirgaria hyperparasitica TaxID=470096 RepID=A0A6A6WJH1_9PEZI|nr:uncharacterized protein EJ05DRAFT_134 [Pseudovirgaria hyperparasitica]KAF2762395.1 hypothetical protein EJ05DRAFT_134 [Pseudovirgaria hyperparasitica]